MRRTLSRIDLGALAEQLHNHSLADVYQTLSAQDRSLPVARALAIFVTRLEENERDTNEPVDLSTTAGRNVTEKLINFMTARDATFASMPLDAQIRHARRLRSQRRVIDGGRL